MLSRSKNNHSKTNGNTLEKALAECHNISKEGFKIAKDNEKALNKIIKEWSHEVDSAKVTFSRHAVSDTYKSYLKELESTKESLQNLYDETKSKFEENAEKLQNFTIVVFGKTTAGKSTLMEILREGDGSSIGDGRQRTTRDVRSYSWKKTGIKFYDVPGIASAKNGGEDDDRIAFEAVEYADLVLFLITDDSVQSVEAEWLARIRKKGKPVICILNVKACGRYTTNKYETRIKTVKSKFTNDKERLDEIKHQFLAFASMDNIKQDWSNLPFWYVDLHTAWLSQQDKEHARELYELSNFKQVEDDIIDIVKNKGAFYQYKTFIDNIYDGIWNTHAKITEQISNYNRTLPLTKNNKDKLKKLKNSIHRENRKELEAFIDDTIINKLKQKVSTFAEDHYEDKNCGKAWEKVVCQLQIEKNIKSFVKQRSGYTRNRLQEFCKEFAKELRFTQELNKFDAPISAEGITDLKFGAEVANSLAAIGVFFLFGPIGAIITGVVGKFLSWLFCDSKEEKIRAARNKLEETLKFWIDGSGDPDSDTRSAIEESFNTTLQKAGISRITGNVSFKSVLTAMVEKTVYEREKAYFNFVDNNFDEFIDTMQKLYNKESGLVDKLRERLYQLNQYLLIPAFKLTGIDMNPVNIERELGKRIEINLAGKSIETAKINEISDLMQEKVVIR